MGKPNFWNIMLRNSIAADPISSTIRKDNLMDYVLQTPSYGWKDAEGGLVVPTAREIVKEFWFRLNIFRTKKNWLALFSWMKVLLLIPCLVIFLFYYFNFYLLGIFFVYGMVVM